MKKTLLFVSLSIWIVAGCANTSNDLDKKSDQALRDNLSRPLNAEELKQMGGGGSAPQGGIKPAEIPAGKVPRSGQ